MSNYFIKLNHFSLQEPRASKSVCIAGILLAQYVWNWLQWSHKFLSFYFFPSGAFETCATLEDMEAKRKRESEERAWRRKGAHQVLELSGRSGRSALLDAGRRRWCGERGWNGGGVGVTRGTAGGSRAKGGGGKDVREGRRQNRGRKGDLIKQIYFLMDKHDDFLQQHSLLCFSVCSKNEPNCDRAEGSLSQKPFLGVVLPKLWWDGAGKPRSSGSALLRET